MHELMLIIHFLGLAMGLGTSFAYMFLGIASSKLEASEALKFNLQALSLSRMGIIGLTLLILSGLYLMTPHWDSLLSMPLLLAKLFLVLVLVSLIAIMTSLGNKAKRGDAAAQFKKIAPLGKIALLTAIVIVVLAVVVFQ